MLQILTELLNYARKLLPLMEIYAARRAAAPARDPSTHEFQNHVAEVLRANRAEVIEIRSVLEGVHQRLRVVDATTWWRERRPPALPVGLLVVSAGALAYLLARPDGAHAQPLYVLTVTLLVLAAARIPAVPKPPSTSLRT